MTRSVVFVLVVVLASVSLHAEEEGTSDSGFHAEWNVEVAATNNVVWRGFLSNRTAALQPSITLTLGAFEINSTSVLEFDGRYCWKEHDLQLSYTRPLYERLSLTAGYINYAFPAVEKERFAHEFFTGLSFEGATSVRMLAFQNVGASTGSYLSLELSHGFRKGKRLPIEAAASLGYNRRLFIAENTFSDAAVTISTVIPLGGRLSIAPEIGFSRGLNRQYFANYVTGGVRLAYGKHE